MWKIEDRKELLTAPITLPPLDEQTLSELRQHYDEAADAETRIHFPQFFRGFGGKVSHMEIVIAAIISAQNELLILIFSVITVCKVGYQYQQS